MKLYIMVYTDLHSGQQHLIYIQVDLIYIHIYIHSRPVYVLLT